MSINDYQGILNITIALATSMRVQQTPDVLIRDNYINNSVLIQLKVKFCKRILYKCIQRTTLTFAI